MKKSIMKFILFLLRNRKHNKPARVQKCNLTEQVNRFLQNSYLFRYNLLTDETEYRPPMPQTKRLSPLANGN